MIILIYILKVILISGALYGYYYYFLRNSKFHLYNRYYLLVAVLLSLFIPLIPIAPWFRVDSFPVRLDQYNELEEVVLTSSRKRSIADLISWANLFYCAYLIILWGLLIVFIKSVYYIYKLARISPFSFIDDIKIYQTSEPNTPFSFFKKIFWNQELNIESGQGQQILRHEIYHVKQHHSVDIILIELIMIVSWINPFFYFIKKEIKTIHEFLADEYAMSGSDKAVYAELLVIHAIATKQNTLTNPFFQNQIKRRIAMISESNKPRFAYLRRVMVLPLLFALCCAFSNHIINNNEADISTASNDLRTFSNEQNAMLGTTDTTPVVKSRKQKDTIRISRNELETMWKDESIKEVNITKSKGTSYISSGDGPVYAVPSKEFEGIKNEKTISKTISPIFTKVEIEPEYPGGYESWAKYLNTNLKYPVKALDKEIQGTVLLQFIIDTEGNISDIKAISGPNALKDEAIRIVRESGQWLPAIQNGHKVKAYKKQPITFKLARE